MTQEPTTQNDDDRLMLIGRENATIWSAITGTWFPLTFRPGLKNLAMQIFDSAKSS